MILPTDHHAQDMAHGPRVPRITTRGSYCLENGRALVSRATYRLYPQCYFENVMRGSPEAVIVIHGMRNDSRGALEKVIVARNTLARLRPSRDVPPVVGFSYDSNTLGAHIRGRQTRALAAGRRIARANGRHLAKFVLDFKSDEANERTRLRLLGHSLGTEVIFHAVMHLAYGLPGGLSTNAAATAPAAATAGARPRLRTRGIIESIHLFGSSLPADIQDASSVRRAIDHTVRGRLVNYYAPTDDVLFQAASEVFAKGAEPLGLCGATGTASRTRTGSRTKKHVTARRYLQRRVLPADHRFASYADALSSFP